MSHLQRDTAPLGRQFFARAAVEVARDCLGKVLLHGAAAGRIVEVEAYLGVNDPAAHASHGITNRTRVLFGPPGHAYVYLIYGMYHCLNFVAEKEGSAGCVLVRAIQPLVGLPEARPLNGPGKLTMALGITRQLNGSDLVSGPLTLRKLLNEEPFKVEVTSRIGIRRAVDAPLRFVVKR